MCGIIGYIGSRQATPILIGGLRKLEYRGYDSAGVSVLNDGASRVVRAKGKLSHLEEKLQKEPALGTCGIGHTRWATHGRPSDENSHPHKVGAISVIHNGIIENHLSLRQELAGQRYAGIELETSHAVTFTPGGCTRIAKAVLPFLERLQPR